MSEATKIKVRPIDAADTEACGCILYEAFKAIAERHRFRPDFPSAEAATHVVHALVESPSTFSVVAEQDGEVVGSNFLSTPDRISTIGPLSVEPSRQGLGIGRRLMEAVIERGQDAAGIRLTQDSFNTSSLSLYASLDFEVKELLVLMEGTIRGDPPPGVEVRPMRDEDVGACADLCARIYGAERTHELRDALPMESPLVAVRRGRVTAYASNLWFWPLNHGVAEREEDMRALLLGAGAIRREPIGFLLPTRQASLFRWCLRSEMRVLKPLTLMARGQYQEPRGCYLPSVGY
jgi:ribosomal protein S18 acetylase RimI-like enzyme